MAEVDELEKLKAAARGGLIAANEYEQQQRAVEDLRQRTLAQQAQSAGALPGSAKFAARQQAELSAPLEAQAAAAGTQAQGARDYGVGQQVSADQYLGDVNAAQQAASRGIAGAQSAYQSSLGNMASLIQRDAARIGEEEFKDQLLSLTKLKRIGEEKRKAEEDRLREFGEKTADEHNQAQRDEAARKAQLAYSKGELGQDTYDTLTDILKESGGDPEIADALVARIQTNAKGEVLGADGKTVISPETGLPIVIDKGALGRWVQRTTGRKATWDDATDPGKGGEKQEKSVKEDAKKAQQKRTNVGLGLSTIPVIGGFLKRLAEGR